VQVLDGLPFPVGDHVGMQAVATACFGSCSDRVVCG
jgi:hypothetical protein